LSVLLPPGCVLLNPPPTPIASPAAKWPRSSSSSPAPMANRVAVALRLNALAVTRLNQVVLPSVKVAVTLGSSERP
jgi:hypothetical protein